MLNTNDEFANEDGNEDFNDFDDDEFNVNDKPLNLQDELEVTYSSSSSSAVRLLSTTRLSQDPESVGATVVDETMETQEHVFIEKRVPSIVQKSSKIFPSSPAPSPLGRTPATTTGANARNNIRTIQQFKERKNQQTKLLLVSLLENFCSMYEQNSHDSRQLFFSICKKLSQMGIINSEDFLDELSMVRSSYKKAFKELVVGALMEINLEKRRSVEYFSPDDRSSDHFHHRQQTRSSTWPRPTAQFAEIITQQPNDDGCTSIPLKSWQDEYTDEEIDAATQVVSPMMNLNFRDFSEMLDAHTTRYDEDFVEVKMLGKGAFGSVWQARNKLDGIDYAIKKVKMKIGNEKLEKILREVKYLARLDHPNLVRYYTAWLQYTGKLDSSTSRSQNGVVVGSAATKPVVSRVAKPRRALAYHAHQESEPSEETETDETTDTATITESDSDASSNESSNSDGTQTQQTEHLQHHQNEQPNDEPSFVIEFVDSAGGNSNNKHTHETSRSSTHNHTDISQASTTSIHPIPLPTTLPTTLSDIRSGKELYLFIQMQLCHTTLAHYLSARNTHIFRNKLFDAHGFPLVDYYENIRIFLDITKGVAYLHDRQLLHRDLKPGNVFWSAGDLFWDTASMTNLAFRQKSTGRWLIGDVGLMTSLDDGGLTDNMVNVAMDAYDEVASDENENLNGVEGSDANHQVSVNPGSRAMTTTTTTTTTFMSTTKSRAAGNLRPAPVLHQTTGVGTITYAAPEQLSSSRNITISSKTIRKVKNADDMDTESNKTTSSIPQITTRPVYQYTTKSDIYSLGIIFFELFHPFATDSERINVLMNLRNKGVFPEEFLRRWPKEAAFILWMTNEDPDKRPTAQQVLEFELLVGSEGGKESETLSKSVQVSSSDSQTGSEEELVDVNVDVKKVLIENRALKEENELLKARIRELEKQVKH